MGFEHDVLRWLHVLAFGYWIGGELGVFHASQMIVNASLSLEERLRHMDVAYRIDIVHRFAIIFLLAIGLHMGFNLGLQPLGGVWLIIMWGLVVLWCALTWFAFSYRGTAVGMRLTQIDDGIRYILMPLLISLGIWSLAFGEPFGADWYAAKILIFGSLFAIGLFMRRVMQHWVVLFQEMKETGPTDAIEAVLSKDMKLAVKLAYLYWAAIAFVAFLGVTKPF